MIAVVCRLYVLSLLVGDSITEIVILHKPYTQLQLRLEFIVSKELIELHSYYGNCAVLILGD